jgi:hypothetical protein
MIQGESPWHELLSFDLLKEAISTVPGFANKIADLAKSALSRDNKPSADATKT